MTETAPSTKVILPPGVTVGAGRETSQTNAQGQVVQGMVFPITLPSGSTTSVFVPYAAIHDATYVQQLIGQRVEAIMAISG
ncbi:MAG TPA: hypothetical protein VND87_09940 [Stellaceae bacterium]|nr:hypothetical protein [Stellaceae bacterium]